MRLWVPLHALVDRVTLYAPSWCEAYARFNRYIGDAGQRPPSTEDAGILPGPEIQSVIVAEDKVGDEKGVARGVLAEADGFGEPFHKNTMVRATVGADRRRV